MSFHEKSINKTRLSAHRVGVMLGFVKKEENSSMTTPLLPSSSNDDIGLPRTTIDDDAELIAHILTSSQGDSVFAPYDGVNTYSTQRNFLPSRNLYPNGYTPHTNGYSSHANGYPPRMNGNAASNGYTQVGLGKVGFSNGNVPHQSSDLFGINNIGLVDEEINTSSFSESREFEIEYIKYPDEIIKKQRRKKDVKSCQRLEAAKAKVTLGITIAGVAQVAGIKVFVARVCDPTFQTSDAYNGDVELEVKQSQDTDTFNKYRISVNLDSVYEIDNKPVYALAKNKTEEANLFNLKISVMFVDGSVSEHYTKAIKIIGKAKDTTKKEKVNSVEDVSAEEHILQQRLLPPPIRPGVKRMRTGTDESNGSNSSENYSSPRSNFSNTSGYSTDSPAGEGLLKASRVVADYLEASKAEIGELIVAEPIKTTRGDIAYHFLLRDPEAHPSFDEGEIVGMFMNERGDMVLDKLTQKNSLDAILKGVISRSQYIEARVQPEGVRTETICMFGIVPVKIRGNVNRGDILYASHDTPGVAVSSPSVGFSPSLANDAAAIGVAWRTIGSAYKDELNTVDCLVSITMEVFQGMMEKRVKQLKTHVDTKFDHIDKARQKSRRRRIICYSALATFVILLSILLWQIFMPGSALRTYICGRGALADRSAEFYYVPTRDTYNIYHVKGLEFTFSKLQKKSVDAHGVPPINGTGYRYYFNVDRCSGATSRKQDGFFDKRTVKVGGPHFFAVDANCKQAYYYKGSTDKWCRYRSSKQLRCTPKYVDGHKVNTSGNPIITYCWP